MKHFIAVIILSLISLTATAGTHETCSQFIIVTDAFYDLAVVADGNKQLYDLMVKQAVDPNFPQQAMREAMYTMADAVFTSRSTLTKQEAGLVAYKTCMNG